MTEPVKKYALIALYISTVVAANVATASTVPLMVTIGGTLFVITWGTWFIGATFFLRDAVQTATSRATAYKAIAVALLASLALSRVYGDLLWVTVASALAFGLSEALDTEIFTRWETTLARRVFVSGFFGGLLDSALFIIVGLSPLTTGIVPWSAVPAAILGQWVVKTGLQGLAAMAVAWRHREVAGMKQLEVTYESGAGRVFTETYRDRPRVSFGSVWVEVKIGVDVHRFPVARVVSIKETH